MKTIINALSWVSYIIIAAAAAVGVMYSTTTICTWLREVLCIDASTWAGFFLLAALLLVVGVGVTFFFMLGFAKIRAIK